jgi:cell division protein FtsB
MACWCETNDKEKTKSISDAEARISDLTTKIEELTASSARLNTEIKNLEKEVAGNQNALDKATAI